MKITHCIQELNHLIIEDGNLEVEKVAIDNDKLCVLINNAWYEFEQYKKSKVEDNHEKI